MKKSNSELKKLCIELVRAESEKSVLDTLQREELWESADWQLYGGKENNYSQIGNQQSEPDAALTEKLTNAVDAVLMRECLKRDVDPEEENAPQTVTKAVEKFFDIEDGFLYNISAKKRTGLAQNIGLVATGERSNPNYAVFDKGEGQKPEDFSKTFLSLEESNKLKIPFVQGQFNMGGSGALRFCGEHNIQLLISRRNPEIVEGETKWGFTVVRRVDPEGNRKNSVFQYLTLEGEIPSFSAESLPILPGDDDEPYEEPLKAGSYLKLYDYNMKGYKTNILFDLYNRISLMLPQIAVPIRFYERRDYSGHSLETTMSGLNVRLEEDRRENLVEGFPSSATFNVEGNEFKAKIFAFKKDLESGESQAEKYRRTEGIIFTKTGQTHGNLHKRFFSRKAVGMSYLKDSLFVIVNCDDIGGRAREDLFMNSRDRLSEGDLKDKLEEELEDLLSDHQGLKELRNKRRQEEMEKKVEESEALENVLDDFLNKSPTLESLFVQGDSLSNPFDIREEEKDEEEEFEGQKRPSYFRLVSDRYRNKKCPINKRCRIKFETDVENQYFDREHLPGEFILERDGEEVSDHSLNLWNGIANLNIELPENADVGDEYKYKATVKDPVKHEPFVEEFSVEVTDKQKRRDTESGDRKNKSGDDDGDDGNMPSGLSLPNIREVTKEEWEEENFTKHTALKIVHTGEGDVYDFYVNMDNIHLHSEIKQNSKSEAEVLKAQYKFAMVLMGLSLIRDYREEEEEEPDRDIEDEVYNVTKAISPVVIPMITELEELVE